MTDHPQETIFGFFGKTSEPYAYSVDVELAPLIKLMNDIGIRTYYSCQGYDISPNRRIMDLDLGYVVIEASLKNKVVAHFLMNYMINKIGFEEDSLADVFIIELHAHEKYGKVITFRFDYKSIDVLTAGLVELSTTKEETPL